MKQPRSDFFKNFVIRLDGFLRKGCNREPCPDVTAQNDV